MLPKVKDPRVRVFLLYMYVFTLATTVTHALLTFILRDFNDLRLTTAFVLANVLGFLLLRRDYLTISTLVYLGSYFSLNLVRALSNGLRPEYAVQFFALFTLMLCLRLPRPVKFVLGSAVFIAVQGLAMRLVLDGDPAPSLNPALDLASSFMNIAIGFFMVAYTLYCFIMLSDRSEQNLRTEANTDGLTGVLNRRALMAELEKSHYSCSLEGKPLCAVLVDVDFFKKVNDTYGHLAGDEVLKRLARMLQSCIRRDDSVGRYGGEEFVLLLPSCPLAKAVEIAERVRSLVAQAPVETSDGAQIACTVSLGVAQVRIGESPLQLLAHADTLLYRAKQNGRNRVEYA